jgi:hypothetical protein
VQDRFFLLSGCRICIVARVNSRYRDQSKKCQGSNDSIRDQPRVKCAPILGVQTPIFIHNLPPSHVTLPADDSTGANCNSKYDKIVGGLASVSDFVVDADYDRAKRHLQATPYPRDPFQGSLNDSLEFDANNKRNKSIVSRHSKNVQSKRLP